MSEQHNQTTEEEFDLDDHDTEQPDQSTALSYEDLNSYTLDHDRDEEEAKKFSLPRGDYKKEDIWEPRVSYNDNDKQPGDFDSKGRMYIQFGGRLKKTIQGVDYEDYITFRISPDPRDKKTYDAHGNIIEGDDESKHKKRDRAYKLFIDSKKVYEAMYEEKPRTLDDIVTMLRDDEYILNLNQFGDSNYTMQIKSPRRR